MGKIHLLYIIIMAAVETMMIRLGMKIEEMKCEWLGKLNILKIRR